MWPLPLVPAMPLSLLQFFVVKEVTKNQASFHQFEASGSTYKPEGDMYVTHSLPPSLPHSLPPPPL